MLCSFVSFFIQTSLHAWSYTFYNKLPYAVTVEPDCAGTSRCSSARINGNSSITYSPPGRYCLRPNLSSMVVDGRSVPVLVISDSAHNSIYNGMDENTLKNKETSRISASNYCKNGRRLTLIETSWGNKYWVTSPN